MRELFDLWQVFGRNRRRRFGRRRRRIGMLLRQFLRGNLVPVLLVLSKAMLLGFVILGMWWSMGWWS